MPSREFDDTDADAETSWLRRGSVATARAAAGLRVAFVRGPQAGQELVLRAPVVVIGRGAAADVRVTDPAVSAFHAELSVVPSGVRLRDLESRNGTTYSGARVADAVLPSGASVELGGTTVRLTLLDERAEPAPVVASFGELRGESPAMRAVFAVLARLSRTALSVFVGGPTGTGKELAARALHDASPRAGKPYVVVDCTSIPTHLAESLLFGHERGAFTGATERRAGLFEAAHGGTLFLDEIGELPEALQPKLLRVLERREVLRVGASAPRAVDVRVVSASLRDLRAMVNQGRFREDLFYRLAQATVTLPALDARKEDLPMLVAHFLDRCAVEGGARAIGPEALAVLEQRAWPGNVRELRNVVERAAAMAAGPSITPDDLAFERILASGNARSAVRDEGHPRRDEVDDPARGDEVAPFKEAKRVVVEEFEREYLARLMQRTRNNLSRAAALAGVERHYLRGLVNRYGLRGADGDG